MTKAKHGSMYDREKLRFRNNRELETYYEEMYKKGGYDGGWVVHGINLSAIYHKARFDSALKSLDLIKEDVVLDAGCGDGKFSFKFARKCKKLYAVDIARNAFLKSRSKTPKNLVFRKMNLEDLKFFDGSFDKIACIEALEHVLHPKKAVKEFYRVLKKDGIAVLTYPMINQSLLTRFEMRLKLRKFFSISEHINELSYDEIIWVFEKSGFAFVSSEGIGLDLGKLAELFQLTKGSTKRMAKLQVSVKKFPRNSHFVSFVFRKK